MINELDKFGNVRCNHKTISEWCGMSWTWVKKVNIWEYPLHPERAKQLKNYFLEHLEHTKELITYLENIENTLCEKSVAK